MQKFIDIVFDGPPDHEAPRCIEVKDEQGQTISGGTWVRRVGTSVWVLRLHDKDVEPGRGVQPDVPIVNGIRADRPQAASKTGLGLKFEVSEFGGDASDMMPQAVTVTDWEGRSAVYAPLPPSQQPTKGNVVQMARPRRPTK